RRHAHVHHRHVRLVLGYRLHEGVAVADGRHHLAAELFEQPDQALPDQNRVIGHDYPHGTSATITVGPPAGGCTASSPSTARRRRGGGRSTRRAHVPWRCVHRRPHHPRS